MALPRSNTLHPNNLCSNDLDLHLQNTSLDTFLSDISTFTGENTFLMESDLTLVSGPLSSSSCSTEDRCSTYDYTVPSHDLLLYLDGEDLCTSTDLMDGTFVQQWNGSLWGSQESDFLKMDEVFQVDKEEAIQGPTLAELNANESLLEI